MCIKRSKLFFIVFSLLLIFLIACISYQAIVFRERSLIEGYLSINEIQPNEEIEIDGVIYTNYIEIYNSYDEDISLDSFYLSDDVNNLKKIKISDYIEGCIKADSFVIVQIDDKLMRIKNKGKQVFYLSNDTGNIIDTVITEEILEGFTYSRLAELSDEWDVLEPSPECTNRFSSEKIYDLVFSHDTGFYSEGFDLGIYAPSDCKIYYTLDSSDPDENSILYTEKIKVVDPSDQINQARKSYYKKDMYTDRIFIVRAICMHDDGRKSEIVTKSYIIDKDKYKDYYVISLVVDPYYLYDTKVGRLVSSYLYLRGPESEFPGNFDLIDSSGSLDNQAVGLRVTGNTTRNLPSKSFNIYSRDEYSGRGVFNYQIFDGVYSHRIRYRGSYGSAITHNLAIGKACGTLECKHAWIFLNGDFYTEAALIETYDERFFEQHYGIARDNIIIAKNFVTDTGTDEDVFQYQKLSYDAEHTDLSIQRNYDNYVSKIDLQSFIDYFAIRVYIDDMDFTYYNNEVVFKSINVGDGKYEDGKWHWCLYDLDACDWDDVRLRGVNSKAEKNTFTLRYLHGNAKNSATNQHKIYKGLKENENFRRQFTLSFMDIVNSTFRYDNVMRAIESYGPSSSEYMGANTPSLSSDFWIDFFKERPKYITKYLKEEMRLSGTIEEINIKTNDSNAGSVKINTIYVDFEDNEWSGSYYTDYAVTITATPNIGYEFVGFEGDCNSTNNVISYKLGTGSNNISAIFKKIGE